MSLTRPLAASAATLAVIGASVLGTASAASAETHDVWTSTVHWSAFEETTGVVDDAAPFDYATGVAGWTGDAFDGIGAISLSDGTVTREWDFDVLAHGGELGGRSEAHIAWFTEEDEFEDFYQLNLTLTFDGNFAQWRIEIAAPITGDVSGLTLSLEGNLGADAEAELTVDGDSFVATDGGAGTHPVVAFQTFSDGTFDGYSMTPGVEDAFTASATGATVVSFTTAVFDYAGAIGTGYDEAVATASELAPQLGAHVGGSFPVFDGDPVSFDPVIAVVGTPFTRVANYSADPAIDEYLDLAAASGATIGARVLGLPQGITAAVSPVADGLPEITLSGTPAFEIVQSSADVHYFLSTADGASSPITVDLPYSVTAAPAGAEPELAATGADASVPAAAAVLLVGLGTTALLRRPRRA